MMLMTPFTAVFVFQIGENPRMQAENLQTNKEESEHVINLTLFLLILLVWSF